MEGRNAETGYKKEKDNADFFEYCGYYIVNTPQKLWYDSPW